MAVFIAEERRSIDERLQHWLDRLDEIVGLVKQESMSRKDRERAQELFGRFKDDLEAEKKAISTSRGEARLTPAERALYLPSILNAHANLSIRRGSNPNSEWLHNLSYIRVDLAQHMSKYE